VALVALVPSAAVGDGFELAAAPKLLSCDHSEDWSAFSATLDGLRLAPSRRDDLSPIASSLPEVCSRSDDTLFRWSDQLTSLYWPEKDPWASLKDLQYSCDPDKVQPNSNESRCDVSAMEENIVCLYGIVTCMACMSVMYACNAAEKPDWAPHAVSAASSLQRLLISHEKVLEFINFSSWPFSLEDVVAIIDVYVPALKASSSGSLDYPPHLRMGSRPWGSGLPARAAVNRLAKQGFDLVDSWRWPSLSTSTGRGIGAGDSIATASMARMRSLRLWAFGTHCSLMAEPIASIALLLAREIKLEVTWRGTKDYCGYHKGDWPVPVRDLGSEVKEVLDRFSEKEMDMTKKKGKSTHRDSVGTPKLFAAALREALARDPTFMSADVGFCSEPAYACIAMHEAGKPLIGYFGVHIGFMVQEREDQLDLYRYFRDTLSQDSRSTLATVAPYISLQMFYNMPVEIPAVRPLTLYTLPAVYTATRAQEVLVNKRPIAFWDTSAVLNACVKAGGINDLSFVDAAELYKVGETSYEDWGNFRAAIYFPYDWLQTLTFYDWVNMGLPTFVPNSPLYTFASGTNAPGELEAAIWHVPPAVYPHHFSDWPDSIGRVYWWSLTDFQALPGVRGFTSQADLFMQLSSQRELWRLSGQLRLAHMERAARATTFWRSAVLRALGASE